MFEQMDIEEWVEEFLTKLIELIGLDVGIEELSFDSEDMLNVELTGPDSALLIGRDGQVLEALQHIVVSAAMRADLGKTRVSVDVEDYRARREARIREEACQMAEEVQKTGRPVDCIPMSPRERRIVHMTVAEMNGVATESIGRGDERFVRIQPAK